MESLGMSKLDLSNVDSRSSNDNGNKRVTQVSNLDTYCLIQENDKHCKYRQEIWKNLLEKEKEKLQLKLLSPQANFRGALVQLLRDVSRRLSLSIATLHSAICILDLFMDVQNLRVDKLSEIALACLSLAGKSEEKFNHAPSLKSLSKVSGVKIAGSTFRQLEWMVGQHVRWRLLLPTVVTYATQLTEYIVTEADLSIKHKSFVQRFKRDGAKQLAAYLDLTLTDVQLKLFECVDLACACMACARAELGLIAWPRWLADITGRTATTVAPIAKVLHGMMRVEKSSVALVDSEDQGYSSTSPSVTPSTSPQSDVSRLNLTTSGYSVLDLDVARCNPIRSSDVNTVKYGGGGYIRLSNFKGAIDMSCRKIETNNPSEIHFYRSGKLIEASLENIQPTNVAVKRIRPNVSLDVKRYKLAQTPQVVL